MNIGCNSSVVRADRGLALVLSMLSVGFAANCAAIDFNLQLEGAKPALQTKVMASDVTVEKDLWYVSQGFDGLDVHVRMAMKVDLRPKSTPCLRLGEQTLWLSDERGRMRTDGWYFKYQFTNQLDIAASDVIASGREFVLEFKRANGKLDILVDGRRIWRKENDFYTMFGWLGIDPRGARVQVREIKVTAETFTMPGRDDPAIQYRKIAEGVKIGREFPLVDISQDTNRQSVIGAGTKVHYQGHPTAAILDDGKTIIATWTPGHGGPLARLAESKDGGVTWTRVEERLPKGLDDMVNCPSIYRMEDPQGRKRLRIFSAFCWPKVALETMMPSIMSEDDGKTWKRLPALGRDFGCIMAFSSMVRLKDGSYLAGFHRGRGIVDCPSQVLTSTSKDGGLTWSKPILRFSNERGCCEPCLFRSPDGNTLAMLMRTERRCCSSLMSFSKDEGNTWSVPEETHWALTGDRHQMLNLPDGRIFVAFRDVAPNSPTRGHFVGWIGTFDELRSRKQGGSYRVKLLHNYNDYCDCGYPGLVQTADGTIVAITYLKYWNDERLNSVVGTRFKVAELDALLRQKKGTNK